MELLIALLIAFATPTAETSSTTTTGGGIVSPAVSSISTLTQG